MINLNDMAKTIAEKEGGSRQVDITQIKQIMKIFLEELAKLEDADLIALVERYYKK
jgi:hypothetical protein